MLCAMEVIVEHEKELLIKYGARRYSLGIDLEAAKEKVRRLALQGTPYDSREMMQATDEYSELKSCWDNLEQEYLALRNKITIGK